MELSERIAGIKKRAQMIAEGYTSPKPITNDEVLLLCGAISAAPPPAPAAAARQWQIGNAVIQASLFWTEAWGVIWAGDDSQAAHNRLNDASKVLYDAVCDYGRAAPSPAVTDAPPVAETSNCCKEPLRLYTADLKPYYVCSKCGHFQRFHAAADAPAPPKIVAVGHYQEWAAGIVNSCGNDRVKMVSEIAEALRTAAAAQAGET